MSISLDPVDFLHCLCRPICPRTLGVFVLAKLVLVSGNCPFGDRNFFEALL